VKFQCPACLALVSTSEAERADDDARAGLRCPECEQIGWLPFSGTAHSDTARSDTAHSDTPQAGTAAAKPPRETAKPAAFEEGTLAELEEKLAAMEVPEGHRELAAGFDALIPRWDDVAAHKALILRASTQGALPAVGMRYRAVLDAAPDDERSLQSQKEILALATAQLQSLGTQNAGTNGTSVGKIVGAIVAFAAFIGVLVFVVRAIGSY